QRTSPNENQTVNEYKPILDILAVAEAVANDTSPAKSMIQWLKGAVSTTRSIVTQYTKRSAYGLLLATSCELGEMALHTMLGDDHATILSAETALHGVRRILLGVHSEEATDDLVWKVFKEVATTHRLAPPSRPTPGASGSNVALELSDGDLVLFID